MNKRLHRVVFNAARGLRVVVQETARVAGKASGATALVSATVLMAAWPVSAQIVGALGVAPNLRPTVLVAPNGVPLVNIQTPSAAGVSRNLYHQFDVQPRGVILNNSRTDVQTQLGGWVQGNPYLATGPARVILNEITSGNPTQLRGAIEVGGQRAEVIVANPAGIAVDGATFINANRATLTTGAPQLDALGGLEGYMVRGGTITFDGAGLDARGTDYAAILARAVQVNAGIWANELKVVTGANLVSADHAQATLTAGIGTAPVFALDVSHLGGMYANKIFLVGTEAGVGARNAGAIHAAGGGTLAGPGEFVVTAAGRLENLGTMQATDRGEIAAESLANSGRIASGGDLRIATPGPLGNAGGTIEAQSLQLTAGGDIDNRGGTLRQTSGVGLTISAPAVSNTAGGVIGAEPVPEAPVQPGSGSSEPADPGTSTGTNTGTETVTGGSAGTGTTSPRSYVPAPGHLTASGAILNDGGRIYAGGPIQLQTSQVNNSGGAITTTNLAASGPSFSNAGGTLNVGQSFSASVDRFDNIGGTLRAGSLQIASRGDLINQDGQLLSDGSASLSVAGAIDNTRGNVASEGGLSIHAAALTNSGTLRAGHEARIEVAGALVNEGSITAGRHITIAAGSVQGGSTGVLGAGIRSDGQLASVGDLRITSAGALAAHGAHLAAGGMTLQGASLDLSSSTTSAADVALTATAGDITTNGATITSPGILSVSARGAVLNTEGTLAAAGSVDLRAATIVNDSGLIRSGATTTLNAGTVVNTNTVGAERGIEGRHVSITASEGLDNADGAIRADLGATITSSGVLHNTRGLVSAGETLAIADPADPATRTLVVRNTGGTLLAGQSLRIDAAALHSSGQLLSAGHMRLALAQDAVLQAGSETIANRDLAISAAGTLANSGRVAAGGEVLLAARRIDNTATGDIQGRTTRLAALESLTNRGVIDGVSTRIDAASLTNIGTGRLYGDHVSIGAGTLENLPETAEGSIRSATIAARQRLDIGAQVLHNREGSVIFSDGDLAIGGGLDAEGVAIDQAGALNNHAALIEATRHLDIKTAVLNNTHGGVTWTLQPGPGEHIVEYAVPGSPRRWKSDEVLFGFGGHLITASTTGWNGWTATAATDPLLPGSNPEARLLLPSPDYPLERFYPYYLHSPVNSADRSYSTCTGGDAGSCEAAALPGAWYARSDPIWAAFGITAPAEDLPADFVGRLHPEITVGQVGVTSIVDGPSGPTTVVRPFDHPVTQAEYDRWQAYRQAHQQLDRATFAFITTITGIVRGPEGDKPARPASIYDAYDYTVTPSRPVLQSSAPARILAGGAMTLEVGQGLNDMSQILAGGTLSVTGGRIANRSLMADAPTVQTGTAIHSYVKAHGSRDDERVYEVAPYNLTTLASVPVAAARLQGGVAVLGSAPPTGQLTPGQTGARAQGAGTVQPGAAVHPIVQVGPVRTSTPSIGLPTASLFSLHPEAGSRFLVETDPRFANHRQWLSSDYLLHNLGLDPDATQKRLGDGHYEQRLIREQVAQLTGYRYLDGFQSDDEQYIALMNAGVTFAQRYELRPGMALTEAQMAQLTSDIVWLVEQEVTLPDGRTQRVLVPQVYVRAKEGDIDGSGGLLAGRSMTLQLAGDLVNVGGTIAGRELIRIDAENVKNLAGRISGGEVGIRAGADLDLIGGTVDARRRLDLQAGRDLHVVTTTRTAQQASFLPGAGAATLGAVTLDRVAGLYVTDPGGSLTAAAGRDMNLIGAEIKSAGDVRLSAERDLNLETVRTGHREDIRWGGGNSRQGEQGQETGTSIAAAGNVRLHARRDLTGRAATLQAGEALELDAGNRLTLVAGENGSSAETHHGTKRGMARYSLDAEGRETTLARSTLSGRDIRLRSGGDMALGAVEATGERLDIHAGGRLQLLTQSTTSAMRATEVDNDAAFSSASGSGRTDETSHYNRFNVKELSIRADGGIKAQVGQMDSLASLAQQPDMGWVNQLANDPAFANSVEWQRVKEEHDRWSYHQSGMGPVTALVVSVVAAAVAAPMAAQAGAAAGGSAAVAAGEGVALTGGGVFLSGTGATLSAGVSSAVQAGLTALASQATVSLANNDGDIGAVLRELGSSEGIKAIATSMITAGVLQGLGTSDLLPQNLARATDGSARFTDQLQRQLIDGAAGAVVRSAVNGTSLEDELRDGLANALLNTAAAQGAFAIGEAGPQGSRRINAFAAEAAHALVGCAVGAGRAGNSEGCAPGAIGAVAGHLMAQHINPTGDPSRTADTIEASRLLGSIAAAIAGGDNRAIYIAAGAAGNVVENNELLHLGPRVTAQTRSGYALERINLPGFGETYVDPRLATALQNWIDLAAAEGVNIHFNSAFRIAGQPVAGAVYTPAQQSLHNAGLAVDIRYDRLDDISGGLTRREQQAILRSTADRAGLSWGGDFTNPDRVHFFIDPYGAPHPGRASLIETQQEAFELLRRGQR